MGGRVAAHGTRAEHVGGGVQHGDVRTSIGSVTQGLLTFTDPAAARNAVTVNSRNNATLAAAPCSTSRTHHAVSVNLSYAAPTVFWVRAFLRVVGRPVFASTTACATACTAAAWRVQPSMLWHHLC